MKRFLFFWLAVVIGSPSVFAQAPTRVQRSDLFWNETWSATATRTFGIAGSGATSHAITVVPMGIGITGLTTTVTASTDGVNFAAPSTCASSCVSTTLGDTLTFTGTYVSIRIALTITPSGTGPLIDVTYTGSSSVSAKMGPSTACANTYAAYFVGAYTLGCEAAFTYSPSTNVLTADSITYTTTLTTPLTQGSVVFAGTGGVIAQDNANFNYNFSTKQFGIGTAGGAAEAPLEVMSGTFRQLLLGSSAAGNQGMAIMGRHFTNAEPHVSFLTFASDDTVANLHIGGGSAFLNGVTQIRLYAAANNTTLGGTARLVLDSTGFVPNADNAFPSGSTTNRWSNTFSTGITATTYSTSGGTAIIKTSTPSCSGAGCVVISGSIDSAGKVSTTTTGAADITITFSGNFGHAPACFANNDTTGNLLRITTTAVGSFHIQGVTVNGDNLSWGCFGF